MKAAITLITLSVKDLERALIFYRDGMGLSTKGIVGTEYEDGAVVFFNMEVGPMLALFPESSFNKDANLAAASDSKQSSPAICLAHNVDSKDEVDQVMQQAAQAGATITNPAHDSFWGGYSGHFQDLDGHLWEVAWNPGFGTQT